MKKFVLALVLLVALLANTAAAPAAVSYPWKNHAAPYTFLFGNHIDSHQQSLLADNHSLQGYLYIKYTGETFNGIPIAEHTDCSLAPRACKVGWNISGLPATGKVASQSMDGASWCVQGSLPKTAGYTHFHWTGAPDMDMDLVLGQAYPGYLIKLSAVSTFYFRHHDTLVLVVPGIDNSSHANVVGSCSS